MSDKKSPQDQIVVQGPGYTIAIAGEPSTLVPYPSVQRPDGHNNYGWTDLRDSPDLVAQIPEAAPSCGLQRVLRAIAAFGSPVMTGACDVNEFEPTETKPQWQVGGYVVLMFKESRLNEDYQRLVDCAKFLLSNVAPTEDHQVSFEFVIEPLKMFFGKSGCFGLEVKAIGFGGSAVDAWAAFEYGMNQIASAIEKAIAPS